MNKFIKFKIPTRPLTNMTKFRKELLQHSDVSLLIKISDEEKRQAELDGFLYMLPKRSENKKSFSNEAIKLLSKIKDPLKFTYCADLDCFYFDLISEYKNLSKYSKGIFRKIFELTGVNTTLLSLARINNFTANISPLKFSHALINDSKELENLGMRRIKGDYLRGVAFVTEEEFDEYKKKLIPTYLNWLETGFFPSNSIKVKMPKQLNISSIDNNPKYEKRLGKLETIYYNDNESFLFDEDTGFCKRKIERIGTKNIFKITLFYKSGQKKIVCYHATRDGMNKRFLSGTLNSSYIYAENGLGMKLYSKKGELITKNYYGITRTFDGIASYTDYTKSFNRFFKKIENELSVELSIEEKERLVNIFHGQLALNIANIEKTIREVHQINIKEYASKEDFIDFMELFFSC